MIVTTQNILKTLGYFDIFQYPLTREEICSFHGEDIPHSFINQALEELQKEKTVFKFDEFYTLQNNPALAQRRRNGNLLAEKHMVTARKVARFLASFPFTKAVAVSGSLSKNFATEKTDIDFFIVTDANRLWIARTFMHLYKKYTFLTGRQNRYCMNYYIDEAQLEIAEKNIFTAIEIITLVPMQGRSSMRNFIAGNEWTRKYFPAHHFINSNTPEIKRGAFRKLVEKLFNGRMGDRFDTWLMRLTDKRWQKKAQRRQLNSKGEGMGMAVSRHFSKPDPKNFQDKIVEQYRIKVQQLLQPHNKTASLVR